METVLLVLAFIVACGLGIVWDYYKPSRFRTNYRNVDKNRGDGGTNASGSDGGGDGGCD